MFRKTTREEQLDLFKSPSMTLSRRAEAVYNNPEGWHNQFFRLVTSQIDEEVFRPLFKDVNNGAPNASLRILAAIAVLKEGFGCSDEQMFEKCDFDLLTRAALGLRNIDDICPSIDTYYMFRRRLFAHMENNGEDLMEKCFEKVTAKQVRIVGISGNRLRMDSKLIGSNIAKCSRYELVHKTLCKVMRGSSLAEKLSEGDKVLLEGYLAEDPTKTVYRSNNATLEERIGQLGAFVYRVLKQVGEDNPAVALLSRVFHDQYEVKEEEVLPRDKKTVKATALQSPHDPDATFRNKNGKNVQGYSTTITETEGSDGKPGLITSVQTEAAGHSDNAYLRDAVEKSERVTGDTVKTVNVDGAYQSPGNRAFAEEHGFDLVTGGLQGRSRYTLTESGEDLSVTDKKTGETATVRFTGIHPTKGRRWSGKVGERHRTFYEHDLEASKLRQLIDGAPPEEKRKRNNVEATIFQYCFHTRNNKTRYRGLFKTRMQAFNRCMWINMRRIVIYRIKQSKSHIFDAENVFIGLIFGLGNRFFRPKLKILVTNLSFHTGCVLFRKLCHI